MANTKLNPLALGYTGAVLAAICMLLLGVLGSFGVYTNAVNAMMQWHLFFSLSISGIIAGMFEGAASGFIMLYVFGWVYNTIATPLALARCQEARSVQTTPRLTNRKALRHFSAK